MSPLHKPRAGADIFRRLPAACCIAILFVITGCTVGQEVSEQPKTESRSDGLSGEQICDRILPIAENLRVVTTPTGGGGNLFASPANLLEDPDLYLTAWNLQVALNQDDASGLTAPQLERTKKHLTAVVKDPAVRAASNPGLPDLFALSLGVETLKMAGADVPAVVAGQVEGLRQNSQYRAGPDAEADAASTFLAVQILAASESHVPDEVAEGIMNQFANLDGRLDAEDIVLFGEPILSSFAVIRESLATESEHERIQKLAREWIEIIQSTDMQASSVATIVRLLQHIPAEERTGVLTGATISGIQAMPSGYMSLDEGKTPDPQTTYYLRRLNIGSDISQEELARGFVLNGWHRLGRPDISSGFFGTYIQSECGSVPETEATLDLVDSSTEGSIQALSSSDLMMICTMESWRPNLDEETVDKLMARSAELNQVPDSSSVSEFELIQANEACGGSVPESEFKSEKSTKKANSFAETAASIAVDLYFEGRQDIDQNADSCTAPTPSNIWADMWVDQYCSPDQFETDALSDYEEQGLFVLSRTSDGSRATLGSLAAALQWSTLEKGRYFLGFNAQ